jgi:hypothetical protein
MAAAAAAQQAWRGTGAGSAGGAAARRAAAAAAAAARRPRAPPHRAPAPPCAGPDGAGAGSGAWRWRSPDWRQLQAATPPARREAERSAMVNEEVVLFIFQLELDSQLQRALNYTAYDAAQQIRAKRESVRGRRRRRAGGAPH